MEFNYYLYVADYDAQEMPKIMAQNYTTLIKHCKNKNRKIPEHLDNPLFHIILWRNLPKTNIADNTEDTLFRKICESIKQYDSDFRSLYIRDLDTLANGSIETFIQRICHLKSYYNKKPIFLDNTLDSLFNYRPLQKPSITNAMQGFRRENEEYENLVGFLENLYVTVKENPIVQNEEGFIHYYFEWQKGNMLVKDILEKLGNMSKRTFYLYVNEFEAHPYYYEYCKLYFLDLIDKEKKGPMSINWQEYYDEINPFCCDINLVTYEEIKEDVDLLTEMGLFEPEEPYVPCDPIIKKEIDIDAFKAFAKGIRHIREKYCIANAIDAYRLWLTAKKKLKIKA